MAANKIVVEDMEEATKQGNASMQRMIEAEMKQAKYKHEDKPEEIQRLMRDGGLTAEEAQQRMARMSMRNAQVKAQEEGAVQISGIVAAGAGYTSTDEMLEEMLDTQEKKFTIGRCIKTALGITRIERMVEIETRRRAHPSFKHPAPFIRNVVHTTTFELIFGLLMILNAMTIGYTAGRDNSAFESGVGSFIPAFEHVFTSGFVIEIALRLVADGWVWIFIPTNGADALLILATGIVPLWIIGPLNINVDLQIIRTLQILRVLRLTRLIRTVRTVKAFRTLWKLIQGIFDSGRTLLWMYIILFGVLYTFAIFATVLIGKDGSLKNDPLAQEHFGTVPKSLLTLFQIATLDSWTGLLRPLLKAAPGAAVTTCFVFFLCIMIVTMVLLNLVMAVIVQNALQRSEQDQEAKAKIKRDEIEADIVELRDIFYEIDENGNGQLDREEYVTALQYSERVQQKFDILEIPENDRMEIWELLDRGDGSSVSVDAFGDCLRALQGGCKAKDSFTTVRHVAQINKRIKEISRDLRKKQALADQVLKECHGMHRQLAGALTEMVDFVQLAGVCIPSGPAKRQKADLDRIKDRMQRKIDLIQGERK
jgi:voltage-gated sodium channel